MKNNKLEMLKRIRSPEHYGGIREWKDKGEILRTQILKRVALAENDYPQINTVDLIKFVEEKRCEVRFGYYTTDRNGKWVWGQYCPCYRKRDLQRLLRAAKREGIL